MVSFGSCENVLLITSMVRSMAAAPSGAAASGTPASGSFPVSHMTTTCGHAASGCSLRSNGSPFRIAVVSPLRRARIPVGLSMSESGRSSVELLPAFSSSRIVCGFVRLIWFRIVTDPSLLAIATAL